MKETIIQFGTGNFLRGFAEDFVAQMHRKGVYSGNVVIVSPTDSAQIAVLNAQQGRYNLYLRGMENDKPVSIRREIDVISRSINPYQDFDAFLALAENPDFHVIISNTTEAGIEYVADNSFSDRPAHAFPAKLTQLLYARYRLQLPGFIILACELVDKNGERLQQCVLQYAKQWALPDAFCDWVTNSNHFCNTLVDRIVSGYPHEEAETMLQEIGWKDRLLDTAELYALWAIEGDYEKEFPLKAAGINVQWCDDVSVFKKRKVRILNGLHTAMVFPALMCGLQTVGECMEDVQFSIYIRHCLYNGILPVLGETQQNLDFASSVLSRFANPYIKHRLQSIALNSVSKFAARVLPTLLEIQSSGMQLPKTLILSFAALLEYYKNHSVSDVPVCIEKIRGGSLAEILGDTSLWGTDLTGLLEPVGRSVERVQRGGMRAAVAWSIED